MLKADDRSNFPMVFIIVRKLNSDSYTCSAWKIHSMSINKPSTSQVVLEITFIDLMTNVSRFWLWYKVLPPQVIRFIVKVRYCKSRILELIKFCTLLILRGYCTPARKLACFACFLLHREENWSFLCMVVTNVMIVSQKAWYFFTGSTNLSCGTVQVHFFPFSPWKIL